MSAPRCPCCGWMLALEGTNGHLWRARCTNCHCHARYVSPSPSCREVAEALARRGPSDAPQLLEELGWRGGRDSARYYLRELREEGIVVQRDDGKWKLTAPTLQPGGPC